ncbi:hypothetical protein E2C01_050930 [Portunus trituberculatus]|uniref:Uncharacterized protein n=1 Tax=Portunus trituberculatus TaxID=210409 RepID=A0A5B7GDE6_PORTR|nr:hypothetical protein [Portunus trituberculatus]
MSSPHLPTPRSATTYCTSSPYILTIAVILFLSHFISPGVIAGLFASPQFTTLHYTSPAQCRTSLHITIIAGISLISLYFIVHLITPHHYRSHSSSHHHTSTQVPSFCLFHATDIITLTLHLNTIPFPIYHNHSLSSHHTSPSPSSPPPLLPHTNTHITFHLILRITQKAAQCNSVLVYRLFFALVVLVVVVVVVVLVVMLVAMTVVNGQT